MKNTKKLVVAFAIGAICVVGTSSSSWASPNPAVSPSFSPSSGWIAVAPLSGSTFKPGEQGISTGVSPRLLGFLDWFKCWKTDNSTWVIQSFSTSYLGSKRIMSIQCGTQETHGYLHIALPETERQKQWRGRITQAQTGANTDGWDDFMWNLAMTTWNKPEVSIEQGNGKVCRSAPIDMYGPNANGQLVLKYTFRPSFIWSMTNNRLITAIPSNTPTC